MFDQGDDQPGCQGPGLPEAGPTNEEDVQGDIDATHAEGDKCQTWCDALQIVQKLEDGQLVRLPWG